VVTLSLTDVIIVVIILDVEQFRVSVFYEEADNVGVSVDVRPERGRGAVFVPQGDVGSSSHQEAEDVQMTLGGSVVHRCPTIAARTEEHLVS
jgi:hypothetical protein